MNRLLIFAPLLLAACEPPGCEAAMSLEPGAVEGTLGGAPWSADRATWRASETGVQVVSPPSEGWRLTLVAQTTDTGRDATPRVRGGGLPIDIVFGRVDAGGWALLNGDGTDTYTTNDDDGGGWLRLARKGGGDLYGCTGFTALQGRRTIDAELWFRAEAN